MVIYQARNIDAPIARSIFGCWRFTNPNRGRSPSTSGLLISLVALTVRGVMYGWQERVGYNFA